MKSEAQAEDSVLQGVFRIKHERGTCVQNKLGHTVTRDSESTQRSDAIHPEWSSLALVQNESGSGQEHRPVKTEKDEQTRRKKWKLLVKLDSSSLSDASAIKTEPHYSLSENIECTPEITQVEQEGSLVAKTEKDNWQHLRVKSEPKDEDDGPLIKTEQDVADSDEMELPVFFMDKRERRSSHENSTSVKAEQKRHSKDMDTSSMKPKTQLQPEDEQQSLQDVSSSCTRDDISSSACTSSHISQASGSPTKSVEGEVTNVESEGETTKQPIHNNAKRHQCSECKAAFRYMSYLKKHMLKHSDAKPHECSVCKATFKRSSYLKEHLLIHSSVKPHQCKVCESTFRSSSNLKQHMLMHTDDKPHSCSVCKAGFKYSSTLKRHMLSHSDVKPFACTVCEASFRRSSTLKNHMLIHSDVKPYQCTVCEASFRQSFHLTKHMLSHSDNKPHQCSTCDAAFKHSATLKKHMLMHNDA